jgi:hypothetical protein
MIVNASRKLLAALSLLALASPALAQRGQYDDRGERSDRYDRDGSYERGRDDRGRDDRGRDDRGRDDWNRDGNRRGGNYSMPGGSWSQSCRRADMAGRTLSAQCKDQRGKWRNTQINPRQCQTGRLGNRFGQLVCE